MSVHVALPQQPEPEDGVGETSSRDWRLQTEYVEATRYLCAGVHLDDHFSRRVVEESLYRPHRALTPSYGVSLVPVILHAIAARRRVLVRDSVITGILVVLLVFAPVVLVDVVAWLVAVRFAVRAVRKLLARDGWGLIRSLLALWLVVAVASLATAVAVAVADFVKYNDTAGVYRTDTSVADVVTSVLVPTVSVWLAVPAIWVAYVVHRQLVRRTLVGQLAADRFHPDAAPPPPAAYTADLARVAATATGNVTAYSEEEQVRPFVGSGIDLTEWSLATPLKLRGPDLVTGATAPVDSPRPLLAGAVLDACRAELVRLAVGEPPAEAPLLDLTVEDHLFVQGVLAQGDPLLDRWRRPVQRVDQSYLDWVAEQPRGRQRHYLTARTAGWGGELVVSGFFHVAIRGGMLYAEFVATWLPPIKQAYHVVDTADRVDARAVVSDLGRALADVVVKAPLAPVALLRELAGRVRRAGEAQWQSAQVGHQVGFDHGARTSVRELGVDWDADPKFQGYDAVEYSRLMSRTLLEAVVRVAREHGYVVSDLERQAAQVFTTITNSVIGSTFHNAAVAVGTGAAAAVGGPASTVTPPPIAAQ